MTIHYSNGYTVEAVLLSREGNAMRVAIRNSDEVAVFVEMDGTWMSDGGQPVDVEWAWRGRGDAPEIRESDCICPPDLAARLIEMLFAGDNPEVVKVHAAGSGSELVS
jgi:hypothetical protein